MHCTLKACIENTAATRLPRFFFVELSAAMVAASGYSPVARWPGGRAAGLRGTVSGVPGNWLPRGSRRQTRHSTRCSGAQASKGKAGHVMAPGFQEIIQPARQSAEQGMAPELKMKGWEIPRQSLRRYAPAETP
jgi:hypothetical protein